jgi:uncharacterized cupin superfamily protein
MPEPSVKMNVLTEQLEDMPFPPEQILEGNPVPKGNVMWKKGETKSRNGIWEHPPGKSDYHQTPEEISAFVFLAGDATITTDDNPEGLVVAPGDVVYFPAGTTSVWDVRETIRVFYHVDGD